MKKLAIATVLAVASIASQAQVTIYGQVNEFVDSTKTGSTTVKGLVSDSSRIGFKVSEQVSNGLTVRSTIETSLIANDPTAGTTQLGNRQSTVGLESKFGSVDMGRAFHGTFKTIAGADPFDAFYGTIATDVHNARGLRMSNATFVNVAPIAGVSVSLDKGVGNGVDGTPNNATVSGAVSGVNLTASRYSNTALNATSNLVGATSNVQLLGATVYVSHSRNVDNGVAVTGDMIGIAKPLSGTAITVKSSIGRTSNGIHAYNVGAQYALSKRTSVEATYRNVNASGTANDVTQLGFGLRHAF